MEGATLRAFVFCLCASAAVAARRDGESRGAPVKVALSVDTSEALHALSTEFLSFAIDTSVVENGWIDFLRHVRLVTLAKALTPAFLRFGGTRQDFLIFQPESGSPSWVSGLTPSWENNGNYFLFIFPQEKKPRPSLNASVSGGSCYSGMFGQFYMRAFWHRAALDELLGFSACSGLRLVFGLNALLRGPSGAWDDGNARLILRHVHARGQDHVSWELGNEPNSYPHVAGRQLSGAQLGADFLTLRTLLRSSHPAFQDAKLYGPDITRPRRSALTLLTGFLDSAKDAIEAVTWHQYYMNGRTATLDNFMDPQILDSLAAEISAVQEVVNKEAPGKAIWLGETSSAWGGGAPGLSDTFVAGFMWLDKLGMAARMGVDVVVRQAFFGHGSYNLVDDHLNPLPDYWLSLLHKRLVGGRVLRVEAEGGGAPSVRVYGHCSSTSFPAGSVTLFALNLGSNPASLSLPAPLSEGPAQGFLLLPGDPDAGLRSRTMMLNGTPLRTQAHGSVPETPGVPLPPGCPLALPPRALAFFVLPEARAPACLQRGRNAEERRASAQSIGAELLESCSGQERGGVPGVVLAQALSEEGGRPLEALVLSLVPVNCTGRDNSTCAHVRVLLRGGLPVPPELPPVQPGVSPARGGPGPVSPVRAGLLLTGAGSATLLGVRPRELRAAARRLELPPVSHRRVSRGQRRDDSRVVTSSPSSPPTHPLVTRYPCSGQERCTECELCPGGWQTAGRGAQQCQPCPAGQQKWEGVVYCTPCPGGYYQPQEGQQGCLLCPEDYYCPSPEKAPLPCPDGAFCPAGSQEPSPCVPPFLRRGGDHCSPSPLLIGLVSGSALALLLLLFLALIHCNRRLRAEPGARTPLLWHSRQRRGDRVQDQEPMYTGW
ncbi:unnamed protein product [Lampetra planeri]